MSSQLIIQLEFSCADKPSAGEQILSVFVVSQVAEIPQNCTIIKAGHHAKSVSTKGT